MSLRKRLRNITLAAAAALSIGVAAPARAEPRATIYPETLISADLRSDTRVKFERNGLEAAVEHIADKDYNTHQTQLGVRTPIWKGIELRQAGVIDYGTDTETSGGFNTNVFLHIPRHKLRFGAGGGAELPEMQWVVHGNARYEGNTLNVVADVLYDSLLGRVDGRGYASVLSKGFYASAGKAKGTALFGILGYIGGPGNFYLMNRNWVEASDGSSKHRILLSWNSTKGRSHNEFQNNLWTAPDGCWELLNGVYDPTIGWAPFPVHYGEFGIDVDFSQNKKGIGGGALFAYNPGNKGNFIEIGSGYRHNFQGEDGITARLDVGAALGAVNVVAVGTADVKKQEFGVMVYLGRKFEM